jgi:hypothetical protein
MARRMPYRRTYRNRRHRTPALNLLVGAGIVGTAVGIGSVATTSDGRHQIVATAMDIGVATGVTRERAPQDGDYWRGCDDARAAGTAPIYRGEPGYRDALDGDNDSIACEPYRE